LADSFPVQIISEMCRI